MVSLVTKSLIACTATILLVSTGLSQQSVSARSVSYELNIPAESLDAALQALALASHHKLLYRAELVAGKASPALMGTYTTEQAVSRLLEGTKLSFEITPASVVLIKGPEDPTTKPYIVPSASDPNPVSVNKEDSGKSSQEFRVAQVDQGVAGPSAVEKEGAQNSEKRKSDLEEIVVTGTHIRGLGIQAAPTMSISSVDIEKTGYSTAEQLFADLPQNFNGITPAGNFATGSSALAHLNDAQASSVDLRGLGAGSTLVLLNGKRSPGSAAGTAVDISAIPLSMIQRVDVVTGGASAIYGSDAVAGVVNIITRRDFDGAESQVNYGLPSSYPGGERLQVSQLFGRSLDRGGFVAAYNYGRDNAFDVVKTGIPSTTGPHFQSLDVVPDVTRQSGFLSGHFNISDAIEFYVDGHYTHTDWGQTQDTVPVPGVVSVLTPATGSRAQTSVSLGALIDIGANWRLDVSGLGGIEDDINTSNNFAVVITGIPPITGSSRKDDRATLATFSAVADGSIYLGSLGLKTAIGVETRRETFNQVFFSTLEALGPQDQDRRVNSVFGEMRIPLVDHSSQFGLRNLELSLAGRYDDYSDFGHTLNPQFALIWEPFDGFIVRGAYARAFRAPDLYTLSYANGVEIDTLADPKVAGGSSSVLEWTGGNPNLGPETARTWSAGFDYTPAFVPLTRVSFSYFNIDYTGRLDVPVNGTDLFGVLANESQYPGLVVRNPAAGALNSIVASRTGLVANNTGVPYDPATQSILSVFPNLILLDNRYRNIAAERLDGLDLSANTHFSPPIGQISLGANSTYTLKHDRQTTSTSPPIVYYNEPGKPVGFRFRTNTGWEYKVYSAFVYLNYTNSYSNSLTMPASQIASWTTTDLTLRFDGGKLDSGSWAHGLSVALSANNLFGRRPPNFPSDANGLGYDLTNANALGRFVSLRVVKKW